MTHDYHAFVERGARRARDAAVSADAAAGERRASAARQEEATARLATTAAAWLHALLAQRPIAGVTVIGPAPCPVERIKKRWRWHVLIKAEHPAELTRLGRYFLERFKLPKGGELRVTFDRDPVALL